MYREFKHWGEEENVSNKEGERRLADWFKRISETLFTMDQNSFLNVTKRVQRKTSVVQRWQEASEIYLDTEGRGRAMDLLTALSQSVVEDFSPYKLSDLLKDKGAKGKIFTLFLQD